HASPAWPPAGAHDEALYLAGGKLLGAPGTGASTFRSAPLPPREDAPLCAAATGSGAAVAFFGAPVARPTLVAGNPFAYLDITSDAPGGLVSVQLYDVPGGSDCGPDARLLSAGAADLRLHAGHLAGRDFPTRTAGR